MLVGSPPYRLNIKDIRVLIHGQSAQIIQFVLTSKIRAWDKIRDLYLGSCHDRNPLAETFLNESLTTFLFRIKANSVHSEKDVLSAKPLDYFLVAKAVVVTQALVKN